MSKRLFLLKKINVMMTKPVNKGIQLFQIINQHQLDTY